MARKVNQVLWDQWRQRLEGQRASGLSIAGFCRREGVSQASFHAWKRRLRGSGSARRASRGTTAARRARKQRFMAPQRARPQPFAARPATPRHAREFLQLPVRGVRSSPWIELSLVDGTLVRVPQENLAALTMLLKVLRGDGCDALSGEVDHA